MTAKSETILGRSSWRAVVMAAVFAAVFSFWIYRDTLSLSFVQDDYHILNNFMGRKLLDVLGSSLWPSFTATWQYIRPVADVAWLIDMNLWGYDPWGYHLTNTIMHSLNTTLVCLFLYLFTKNLVLSTFGALAFASHPNNPQAVLWLSARADLLCCFFYLGSIITFMLFLRFGRKLLLFTSLMSFVLALYSKEMAITLPFVLGVIPAFSRGQDGEGTSTPSKSRGKLKRQKIRYALLIPYFLILLVYLSHRIVCFHGIGGIRHNFSSSPFERTYLRKAVALILNPYQALFVPVNPRHFNDSMLSLAVNKTEVATQQREFAVSPEADYEMRYETLVDYRTLSKIILLVAIMGMIAAGPSDLLRLKEIRLGMLWLLVVPLPLLATFIASHLHWYYYMPSIGACIIVAGALFGSANRGSWRFRIGLTVGGAVIVLLYMGCRMNMKPWRISSAYQSSILDQIRSKYPPPPDRSILVFYDLPAETYSVPVFRSRWPGQHTIEAAMRLFYGKAPRFTAIAVNRDNVILDFEPEVDGDTVTFARYDGQWSPENFLYFKWDHEEKQLVASPPSFRKRVIEQTSPRGRTKLREADFSSEADLKGWKAVHEIEVMKRQPVSPEKKLFYMKTTGEFSMIQSPAIRYPNDKPVGIEMIEVRMMVEGKALPEKRYGEILWITEEDPDFDGMKRIRFLVKTDGKFYTYRIPLYYSLDSLIRGNISRIAIRPVITPNMTFAVESIKLFSY